MKLSINHCILVLFVLAMTACSGNGNGNSKVSDDRFALFENAGISVDDKLLGDSLTLPDVYCGDKNQRSNGLKGTPLNQDQYKALILPVGHDFPDAMSNWMLLGVNSVGDGITLAAYYAGNGVGYCVDLVTYDKQGYVLDAINAREMHLLWRVDLGNVNNDTVFTLDGYFTFAGNNVTLHRTMGRCAMDFKGDLKSAPQWYQTWEQSYTINPKGHFVMEGQHVVNEKGQVDQYATLDFKSWDMLVCSLHDPGIMDTWNEYTELVNSTYDPDYQYNPFPWDVVQLYRMNPQRFLAWLGAPQNRGNRLLPQFKLPTNDRPELLQEISRMDDANARQWLTGIVNSWDDKPMTKHL